MIRGGVIVLATILMSATTGALAQGQPQPFPPMIPNMFQGTPAEQAACRPDAQRFCRDAGTDTFRVLACLQRHRAQISNACKRVLESHGQ